MTAAVKSELDKIVDTLVETGIVSKIILFGSYARGEETPESDIDLCVLTSEKDRDPLDVGIDLRVKLSYVQETPLDLLTYEQNDFRTRAARPGSFPRHILEHGVALYE